MLLVGIPVSGSGGIGLLHLVVGRFLVHHLRCGGFFLFLVDQGSLRATETGRERLVPEESEEEVRAGRSRHSSVWAGGVRCVQNGQSGVFFSVFFETLAHEYGTGCFLFLADRRRGKDCKSHTEGIGRWMREVSMHLCCPGLWGPHAGFGQEGFWQCACYRQ